MTRNPEWRFAALSYVLALGATAMAVGVRQLLDPMLGDYLPLVTLFPAVAVTVWFGGYGPALLAAILGYIACDFLFIEPRGSVGPKDMARWVGLAAYAVSTFVIILLGEIASLAQRQARARRELLSTTLASIGDAVITTDIQGRVTFLNGVAERLTGWLRADAAGKDLGDVFRIINEKTRQPAEDPAARALREGVVVGLANHTVLIHKDGSERPIDDSAAPIRDELGKVSGSVLVFRDISERRRQERLDAERLANARLLAAIVTSSDDAIVSKSIDGLIQSWNAAAERLFGYSAQEAIGRHISLIVPPDRINEEERIVEQLRAGKRIEHFDTVRQRRDGTQVQVSLTISPIFDEKGKVVGASKTARDITERKQAERRIHQLMSELKEADRRKDEFLATLSHELRGPLAPVRNSLEIIKRAKGNEALVSEGLITMDRQVTQMERLIDDLLDISRVTRGKLELRKDEVELSAIIAQAVETCRPCTDAAKQELTVNLPAAPIRLLGDQARLAQVFGNLLHNACKYTDAGGRIWLTAHRQGSDVVVSVKDNGVGIPADMLKDIFEMFTQVDRGLERRTGGLGIGLTLVKQLVEMHDGRVEAFSDGPGLGSEFVVRLPMVVGVVADRPAAPPSPAQSTKARRILVVDDNRDSAASLAMLLKISGNDTFTAHDGLEAIGAAERLQPDVVLLDIGLPHLNGFDACRRIREQPWGKEMALIALTGWGQDEDRRRSREAGFDAHVVKPVDLATLTNLLASVFTEKRAFTS